MAPNEANSNQNIPLVIQTRGNFFEDSFFEDVREKFERAVSAILEKCGESSSLVDIMPPYRKIRQLGENQAGTIAHGQTENKVVLDVLGCKQDDIKVKDLENNTIEITGNVENKSFHKQFTLPGKVDMTLVTSCMSSDGILIIIVPRLEYKPLLDVHTTDIDSDCIEKTKSDESKASLICNIKSTVESQSSSSGSNYKDTCSKDKYTLGENSKQSAQMVITKRGNFFEDTFFADVRDNFKKAVSEVLEKCGEKSSSCDVMISYRSLRQRDLKEENQAAAVSHGDKEHRIVIDVNGFKESDIKVLITDANTIQIIGTIDKKNGSFHRQFTLRGLPGTIFMRMATSNLSTDGILTVIVPRAEETKSSISSQEFDTQSGIGANLSYSSSKTADVCSGGNYSNLNKERNEYSSENAATTGQSMKKISRESNIKSEIENNLSSLKNQTADICFEDNDRRRTSTDGHKSMTIQKKGNFFDDSFFADVRINFQKSVSEVLEKFGETLSSSVEVDMTSYRNLRQRDLKEENQAATVSYGDKEHKIVMDVNDFKNGDIKVNIIENNRITITGTTEKLSFHRQFTLPGLPGTIDMELATSSLSSDGILAVIIPRITEKQMISSNKRGDICKESYLNEGANQCSQGSELSLVSQGSNAKYGIETDLKSLNSNTTGSRSMVAMKVESKSSVVSQTTVISSSYSSSKSSSSTLESIHFD